AISLLPILNYYGPRNIKTSVEKAEPDVEIIKVGGESSMVNVFCVNVYDFFPRVVLPLPPVELYDILNILTEFQG
ncbi:hypothetical protein L9F63_022871, partial [Diploptera punctata]